MRFPLDNRVPDQSLGSQLQQCDQRAAFKAARAEILYPGWAGIKRYWVPYRLWVWTAANRWLGRSRFVRWLLNRTTWRHP